MGAATAGSMSVKFNLVVFAQSPNPICSAPLLTLDFWCAPTHYILRDHSISHHSPIARRSFFSARARSSE
jgi:hypothetical protein